MARCYIALGSNLDAPLTQVQQAITSLKQLPYSTLKAVSPWYQSKAVGPGKQADYINGVACLDSELNPLDLLQALQQIEKNQYRVRLEHWGPRTLDLDLLLYDNQTINEPLLSIPHPRMKERNFVLYPLFDIAPEIQIPNGPTLRRLLHCCSSEGLRRLDEIT